MKVLQVKKYHYQIARIKRQEALVRWRNRGYGYPVRSMFYFMLKDKQGYPTVMRQKGYVAFNDNKACFGLTIEKAIKKFKKY